jgi:hypothetical protein
MAIVQAGKPVTADSIKATAGNLATLIRDSVQQGDAFRVQLESWPDADLIELGLDQADVNAIKGFYIGDLPQLKNTVAASAWIKQLLGTGV